MLTKKAKKFAHLLIAMTGIEKKFYNSINIVVSKITGNVITLNTNITTITTTSIT